MRDPGGWRRGLLALVAWVSVAGLATAGSSFSPAESLRALLDAGRFAEAEAMARAALAKAEGASGPHSLAAAAAIEGLVEALWRQEKVYDGAALELAERAVAVRERSPSGGSVETAASLLNLACVQRDQGAFGAAEQTYRRALTIAEPVGDTARNTPAAAAEPLLGRILAGLATVLADRGDYGLARPLAERALAIAERGATARPLDVVAALACLGTISLRTADLPAAAAQFERAVAIADAAYGGDHRVTVNAQVLLAGIRRKAGNLVDAASLAERAVGAAERSREADDPLLARALCELATVHRDGGAFAAATPLYERAIAILERTAGPEHFSLVWPLDFFGWSLYDPGDLAAARPVFERALRIAELAYGPEWPETAYLLGGYGNLLRWSGDNAEARAAFERALRLAEGAPSPSDDRIAGALGNLAYLLAQTGELDRARVLIARTIPLFEKIYGPEHDSVAEMLGVASEIDFRLGGFAAMLPLAERSLEIREKIHGSGHVRIADSLRVVGVARYALGDLDGAEAALRRGAEIDRASRGRGTGTVLAITLEYLSQVQLDAGKPTEAFATALEAERLGRESTLLTADALAERQALLAAADRNGGLHLLFSIALRGDGDPAAAWDALIRSRALVLDLMATRQRALRRAGDPETDRLAADLAVERAKFATLSLEGPGGAPPEQFAALLATSRIGKEGLEQALAERSAEFRHDQARQAAGLDDVARALPRDTALVAYALFDEVIPGRSWPRSWVAPAGRQPTEPIYAALVLPDGQTRPAIVRLGSAKEIDALVAAWKRDAAARPPALKVATREAERRYQAAGDALRRVVWDPVAKRLAGAKRVLIVPDGSLHLVNVVALPAADGRYLVESGPLVSYLSAERDLVREPAHPAAAPSLLALGGPDFDSPPSGTPEVLELARARAPGRIPESAADVYRGPRAACEDFHTMRFAGLPGARAETDEVAALWSAKARSTRSTLELTGASAHEALFKELAPKSSVVHLATHGFFLEPGCLNAGAAASPLLSSGLALAGANHRDDAGPDEEDGILTAEEIASLDLSGVDWVVLSACNTGVGQVMNGEGVLGLRRAFEVAGAGTLIMSLWPVQDEASRAWMRALYEARLGGATTADAVRQASLRTLRERRRAGLSTHPFYWGAFVAAGEWR